MWKDWNQKYSDLVGLSKRSSQFGAFILVIMGLVEAFNVLREVYITENSRGRWFSTPQFRYCFLSWFFVLGFFFFFVIHSA